MGKNPSRTSMFRVLLAAWLQVEAQQILQIHENIVRRGLREACHVDSLIQIFSTPAICISGFCVSLAWRPRLCAQVLSRCTSQDVFPGARVLDSILLHFGGRLSTCLLGAGAAMTPRTGKDQDTIRADLMRDNFMSAEEVRRLTSLGFDGCIWYASAACGNRHRKAKDYGLIDQAANRCGRAFSKKGVMVAEVIQLSDASDLKVCTAESLTYCR